MSTVLSLPIWETQTCISFPFFNFPPAGFNPISAIDSIQLKFVPCHAGIQVLLILFCSFLFPKFINLQVIFLAIISPLIETEIKELAKFLINKELCNFTIGSFSLSLSKFLVSSVPASSIGKWLYLFLIFVLAP